MNTKPVHEINITHRWQEIDRVELVGDDFGTTILECHDCGDKTTGLDLDANKESRENDVPNGEMLARIKESNRKFEESMKRYQTLLLAGTEYNSTDDLIDEINKRYNIDARKIPLGQLKRWANQGNRKFKRKALLVYKQGSVCNRCDCIYYPSDLTVDHINGNREEGSLENLQLLCTECHRAKSKGSNSSTKLDVSPFCYDGEQCVHQITCVEVDKLKRVPHNRR